MTFGSHLMVVKALKSLIQGGCRIAILGDERELGSGPLTCGVIQPK